MVCLDTVFLCEGRGLYDLSYLGWDGQLPPREADKFWKELAKMLTYGPGPVLLVCGQFGVFLHGIFVIPCTYVDL